ncbi:hypothetical protein GLAREA_05592 [Glarea lozoyensis ATCC 20868]|uniref:Uncharacterized protein n=1 Tax=Glarea lozoyensis (strain ATCC 20868 / MF5171) TaxID=1116229 RepID=S3DGJ6_GLAL2|nr:uncharacterized protein GLAREA_05592 [Glarea lozoyensis ATCC 20868]EPE36254.1 hypothetical protein GLAREA_05592 [Glarea lozoyensis ATCC 20868]
MDIRRARLGGFGFDSVILADCVWAGAGARGDGRCGWRGWLESGLRLGRGGDSKRSGVADGAMSPAPAWDGGLFGRSAVAEPANESRDFTRKRGAGRREANHRGYGKAEVTQKTVES